LFFNAQQKTIEIILTDPSGLRSSSNRKHGHNDLLKGSARLRPIIRGEKSETNENLFEVNLCDKNIRQQYNEIENTAVL
jgi:hypothetical protein